MIHRRVVLGYVLVLMSMAMSSCDQKPPVSFTLYSTTSSSGGSSVPSTLVTVNHANGAQVVVGATGQTAEQTCLDIDPVSGQLYGVNAVYSPSVLTRIDLATGATSKALDLSSPVDSVAFSPSGELYALVEPRTLGRVDRNT